MADPLVHHHEFGEPWTIDDLKKLPDDATDRYEIYDGSLVVSPRPGVFHGGASNLLHRLLTRQAPDDLIVSHDRGQP